MATTKKATAKAPAKAKAPSKPVKKTNKATKEVTKAPKAAKPVKEAVKPVVKAPKAAADANHSLPEDKQQIIEKFAQKTGDTGSPEVQVALLTHKIDRLIEHLDQNKKDNHSRRGLLKVVAKRRRILNYLVKIDKNRYQHLIGELGLKK